MQQVENKLQQQQDATVDQVQPVVPRVDSGQPVPRVDPLPIPVPRVPIAPNINNPPLPPNPLPQVARRAAQQHTAVRRICKTILLQSIYQRSHQPQAHNRE